MAALFRAHGCMGGAITGNWLPGAVDLRRLARHRAVQLAGYCIETAHRETATLESAIHAFRFLQIQLPRALSAEYSDVVWVGHNLSLFRRRNGLCRTVSGVQVDAV